MPEQLTTIQYQSTPKAVMSLFQSTTYCLLIGLDPHCKTLAQTLVHVLPSLSLSQVAKTNCGKQGKAYPHSQPKACRGQTRRINTDAAQLA